MSANKKTLISPHKTVLLLIIFVAFFPTHAFLSLFSDKGEWYFQSNYETALWKDFSLLQEIFD